MKKILFGLWRDEEGAETAEWVVIVALLVVVGIAIYNGILRNELSDLVNDIGTQLDTAGGVGT